MKQLQFALSTSVPFFGSHSQVWTESLPPELADLAALLPSSQHTLQATVVVSIVDAPEPIAPLDPAPAAYVASAPPMVESPASAEPPVAVEPEQAAVAADPWSPGVTS